MRFPDLNFRRRHISHSVKDYRRIVRRKLRSNPHDRALALAQAIGSDTMEAFVAQGDAQVSALRHHGLTDGMAIYDLGVEAGAPPKHCSDQVGAAGISGPMLCPSFLMN